MQFRLAVYSKKTNPIVRDIYTYVSSEALRSCEKDDDDDRAQYQDAVRQGERHHDDHGDQPRPVRRLLLWDDDTQRHATVQYGADRPQRERTEHEAEQRQQDDDKANTTRC